MNLFKTSRHFGMTLTELLIAASLIGIVTVGAAGVMLGMRKIHGSSRLANFLVIHASSVMAHIQHNAIQAVGYQGNAGVDLLPGTPVSYYAFRQDVDSSWASNNTPNDYSDDTWIIYIADEEAHTLSYCRQSDSVGSTPGVACLAAQTQLSDKIDSLTFTLTASTTDFYVDVELDTIFTPGTASDPMDNPTFNLTTRVTPAAHTW